MEDAMKVFFSVRFLTKVLAVAVFALFSVMAANAQCDTDAETALYNKFLENFKGSADRQKAASQTGKEYLAKFGTCPSENEKKITEYIQKWIAKYEAAVADYDCGNAVDKTPTQAFDLCQPFVAKDPENLRPWLLMTLAGAKNGAAADRKLKESALNAAKRSLALIADGKTVDNWILGKQKEDAVGAVNYYAGFFALDSSPGEAAKYFLAAARSAGSYSKEPGVYDALARAIYNSDYKAAATEYNSKCGGTSTASECDALYAKAGQVLDRVIDAYARAVALSKDPSAVSATRNNLTSLYKQRHDNSDVGLDKLITDSLSKPLP
jgi:hypothetical protein